jgi:hypothetical protein
MATFASASKSNRLLQSKRYTIANTDSQEAYTNVLDINASEIYIQESAITSSGIPYSGSGQNGLFLNSGSSNVQISRYFFRHQLSPSSVTVDSNSKYNVFFFMSGSGFTTGSTVDPQLIGGGGAASNQLTSFLSNKYAAANLAANNAESTIADGGTAYNIKVFKGSSPAEGDCDPVNEGNYQFDYKTGILQFKNDSVSPSIGASHKIFMTAYQYVGQTLDSFVAALSGSSGGGGTPGGDTTQIQFNDGGAFGGNERLVFNKTTGLTQLSGSFEITGSVDNIFLIKSGSVNLLRMSSSGALVFGNLQHTPPPVVGGLFYSSSAFYVGVE